MLLQNKTYNEHVSNHAFLVIDTGSFSLDNSGEYRSYEQVELHGGLLTYFEDTLYWIPSYNPCAKTMNNGLCWDGPTIIKDEGVIKAKSIFKSWVRLLSEGPDIISLRGSFTWIEGESPDNGKYERLTFSKSEIVGKLEKLISFCERIENSGGDECLLHLSV